MDDTLDALIAKLERLSEAAQKTFGRLSGEQINWKPAIDFWSVGQCFEHIIKANGQYFPFIEKALKVDYAPGFYAKVPFVSGVLAHLLFKAVKPENNRKFKSPPTFKPSESAVGAQVVDEFVANQNRLLRFLESSRSLDAAKVKITWAAARFVTFSLLDAYKILLAHEQRHLGQAEKVLKHQGFPTN